MAIKAGLVGLLTSLLVAGCSAEGQPASDATTTPPAAATTGSATRTSAGATSKATATPVATAPTATSLGLPKVKPFSGPLAPADGDTPVAGICGFILGAVVTIDANPDTPGTRCTEVRADQRLRVVNTSNMSPFIGLPVVVLFANYRPRVVQVGSAITFDRPFGQVLAVGDHFVYFAAPRGTICSALAPAYCFGHGYAAEVLLR